MYEWINPQRGLFIIKLIYNQTQEKKISDGGPHTKYTTVLANSFIKSLFRLNSMTVIDNPSAIDFL